MPPESYPSSSYEDTPAIIFQNHVKVPVSTGPCQVKNIITLQRTEGIPYFDKSLCKDKTVRKVSIQLGMFRSTDFCRAQNSEKW